MADVQVVFGGFSSTEVEFRAASAAAREVFASMFGAVTWDAAAAVSVNVLKSCAPEYAERFERAGLTVA
jgi:hypothetical protein